MVTRRPHLHVRRLLAFALLPTLVVAAAAVGADGPSPAGPMASFKFNETPVAEVLAALSEFYATPFRATGPISQPVTLDSAGQVGLPGAIALLQSALAGQGLNVRHEDGAVTIMPRSGLLAVDIEVIVLAHSDPTAVAKVVVELFQTRDVWVELAAKDPKWAEQLMPYLSKSGAAGESLRVEATPWPPLKAVIIKAPKQVMPMIRQFVETQLDGAEGKIRAAAAKAKAEAKKRAADAARKKAAAEAAKRKNQKPPPPEVIKTFQPKFVEAKYISDFCQRLKGFRPEILPHNVLMLKTRKYSQFIDVEAVLDMLDLPDSTSLQQYYVQLQHANAADVRKLLTQLYSYTLDEPVTEAGAAELAEADGTDMSDGLGVDAVEAAYGQADFEQVAIPVGSVTIVADEDNNALIIRTIPANIGAIRDLIAKIDRPRGQVLIEVFIAEVALDDATELGVDFLTSGVSHNVAGSPGLWDLGQDFGVTGISRGVSYGLISDNLNLFVRAMQTSSRLNIISRPSITTLDNSPATFQYGEQVPLVQASNVNISGDVISSVVKYEPVDTKLVVTPHINAGGFITMEIDQRMDEVSEDRFVISEQLEPQLLVKRHVKTNVRVFDGQTVFLGGFIDDKIDETESKVPLLGDIPILGHLFKSSVRKRVKTELLIFITPHIVRTPQELLDATNRKRYQAKMHIEKDLPTPELDVYTGPAPDDPAAVETVDEPVEVKADPK